MISIIRSPDARHGPAKMRGFPCAGVHRCLRDVSSPLRAAGATPRSGLWLPASPPSTLTQLWDFRCLSLFGHLPAELGSLGDRAERCLERPLHRDKLRREHNLCRIDMADVAAELGQSPEFGATQRSAIRAGHSVDPACTPLTCPRSVWLPVPEGFKRAER